MHAPRTTHRPPHDAPPPLPPPGTGLAATLIALLAVVLALVPAWPAAGAGIAVPGPAPVPAAATVPHPDSGHHADDGCATTCAARAGARHDHLGERPAPPDRLGTTTRVRAPPGRPRADPGRAGPVPVSPGRTSHDRGRAPPSPPAPEKPRPFTHPARRALGLPRAACPAGGPR
ncbi:hypothetical protein LV779_11055 [Streptomyces thinghirensis]|nr:hypothetical protein [Streptomyces thinghirensis]